MVFSSSPGSSADNTPHSLATTLAKFCFGAAAVLAGAEHADAQLVSNVVRSGPASSSSSVRLSDPVPASFIKNIATQVAPAVVALTMQSESGPSFGSGTVINVRPEQLPVLMKNEILVATASHLFWDWGASMSLTATVYGDYDSSLKPRSERDYPARLIGGVTSAHSTQFNDVALIAIQVPENELPAMLKRAVRLGGRGSDPTPQFGDVAVTVGCPGSRTGQVNGRGYHKPALPIFQDARVLSYSDEESPVDKDAASVRTIHTIADPKQGHSGGGLFNERRELIGICSASASVTPGVIDFSVVGMDLIEAPNDAEYKRRLSALIPDWAEHSKSRGYFASAECVHELMEGVAAEFRGLQDDLQRVDAHYSEWLKDSEGSFLLPAREALHTAKIQRAWKMEREQIQQKLRGLKPDYE